jgi:hypothetical protein
VTLGRAFPRISEGRPYPPSGLTTMQWGLIQPEWVPWSRVVTTQRHVAIAAMLHIAVDLHEVRSTDPHPHIVEHEGTLYLEDGHNRMVRDLLDGKEQGLCRVLRR